MDFRAGNRVRDREWDGTHQGTITRVDTADDLRERAAEGDDDPTLYVYVQWDGASFTEDQLTPNEVELIPGEGDPTLGVGVFVVPDDRQVVIVEELHRIEPGRTEKLINKLWREGRR